MNKKLRIVLIIAIMGSLFLVYSKLNAQSGNLIHDKSYNVQPGQKLEIKTDVGDISIKTWNKNEVSVRIKGNSRAERKIEFYFDQDKNGVYIRAEKEGSGWTSWFSSLKLDYQVMVPTEFNVKLNTSGGDVDVEDLNGELQTATSGGDLLAKNVIGAKRMNTSGGDVRIQGGEGDVDAGTSGGDIKVQTKNGKIDCGTSGGDIEIDYFGENYGIDVGTSGGDIEIYIPSDFKADVALGTSGGRVKCRAGGTKLRTEKKYKIRGEINGGGREISGSTSGGDVLVANR